MTPVIGFVYDENSTYTTNANRNNSFASKPGLADVIMMYIIYQLFIVIPHRTIHKTIVYILTKFRGARIAFNYIVDHLA